MATYTRNGVSAALTSTTAWAENIIPSSSDTAKWNLSSLGGTQTGTLTVQGLLFEDATSNVVTSNLVSIGTNGITFGAHTKSWTFNGGISVDAAQTWSLNANTLSIKTGLLYGSSIVTINAASGSVLYTDGTVNMPFTGTLRIQNNITIQCYGTQAFGTTTTLHITGTNCIFRPSVPDKGAINFPTFIRLESSMTIQPNFNYGASSSSTFNFTGGIELFGTGDRTIKPESYGNSSNIAAIGTMISGTGNLVKSGTLPLTISGDYNSYSGNTVIAQGKLIFTGTAGFNSSANVDVDSSTSPALELNSITDYSVFSNIRGSGAITKFNTNTVTFQGTASTYSGTLTISGGAVAISADNALGTTGSISVGGTCTLIVNATNAKPVNLATNANLKGGGTQTGNISLTGTGNIGDSSLGMLTVNSTTITGSAQQLNFEGYVVCSSAISTNLVYIGTNMGGDITLSGTSSFTNTVRIYNGAIVRAAILAAYGSSSSLGNQPSPNACISFETYGTGFGYVGSTAATFSRKININNTVGSNAYYFSSDGTGALTIGSNAWSFTTGIVGHVAYLLGSSTANNRWVYPMSDTALFSSVGKQGAGTWVLPNAWASTNTSGVSVDEGTLIADSPDGSARFGFGAAVNRTTSTRRGRIKTLTGTTQRGRHTYGYLTFNHGDIWIGGS